VFLGDIIPPPVDASRPEVLIARTQALENEIRISKQRHEETLQKFKSSCKVWKEGTKKLTLNLSSSSTAVQDGTANRVDGVAAAAKEAESAVSVAMTQPFHSEEIDEINRRVLAECGIPNVKIRPVRKVRPVGKHIEFEPARKMVPVQPGPSLTRSLVKDAVTPSTEENTPAEGGVDVESDVLEEDGHANEAFEAMEAMEFDAGAEFDYDSENHGTNDMGMDMGVD
jgi:hypothetical protein